MDNKFDGCPAVVREFLLYNETIRSLSPRTVYGQWVDLRNFFRYLKYHRGLVTLSKNQFDEEFAQIDVSDIDLAFISKVTTMEVYEYLHFAMKQRENNPATRSRKISTIRAYFKYLTIRTRQLEFDPVKDLEVPKLQKSLPVYLSLEQAIDLLNAVDGEFAARDYCMLTLFLNCGMRVSELVGINIADIHEETITITGKGNKQRQVYLNKACKKSLARYLHDRNNRTYANKDRQALFLSRTGSRLTARRVEQIVDSYVKKAGLDGQGFTVHKLRHTAATLMYRYGGVDILTLKEILGHANTNTTEIYTHLDKKSLKDAVDSSPLAGLDAANFNSKKSNNKAAEKVIEDALQQAGEDD